MNEVDLHCHTTASDGHLTPTQLVERAARLAIRVLAITDHDSVEGVSEAQVAGLQRGVEVVPGVEINTDIEDNEVHVLGYFVDVDNPILAERLGWLRVGRDGRAAKMVQRLAELGVPVSFERVKAIAGHAALGRPHVAQAMIEAGHVGSIRDAFDLYIGRRGPAYVERTKFSPAEACRLIRQAHGVPSLAHPLVFASNGVIKDPLDLPALLGELSAAGLMGLEVYYPNYDANTTGYLMGLARRHGLLLTGGSDFHGVASERADLGSVYVPLRVIHRLRAAWLEDAR